MHLKRLEIQGFKSFASKTAMEFEPGITAVVGPNGSGKSNVADSVRWVLGEQSTKLLRGKKSDDVVFAGSDKKPRSGFAEVVATFDNAGRVIPLDVSEVSIGRRIDRSGESEYLINGQKVRLLDIVDLVLKSNIGTSRYTVIGQGTIDMLIMSGPSEIKNLLDEASGVKVYQIRREKTLKRLEQTAQNLIRVEDVVLELEPRLKSLRRQAKRMEAREQLETELRVLLREYWGGQYFDLFSKLSISLKEQNKITREKDELQAGIDVLVQRRDSLVEKETGSGGKFSEIRNQITELSEKKNVLLEKKSVLSGKISGLKNTPAGNPQLLALEVKSIEHKLQTLSLELQAEQTAFDQLTLQEDKLEFSLAEVSGKLNTLYSELTARKPLNDKVAEETVQSIQDAVEEMLSSLEHSEDVQQAKGLLQSFLAKLQNIKQTLRGLMGGDATGSQDAQQLMSEIVKEKDGIEKELKLILSKRAGLGAGLQVKQKQLQELDRQKLDLSLELEKTDVTKVDQLALEISRQQEDIDKQLSLLSAEVGKLELLLQGFDLEAKERREGLSEVETSIRELQSKHGQYMAKIGEFRIEAARLETELKLLEKEIVEYFGETELESVRLDSKPASTPELSARISKLKASLEQIGGVDEMTLQEYTETENRYTNLTSQIQDLKKATDDLRAIMDELDEHIEAKFSSAFHKVNEHFEQYFRMLFGGGRATLSLVKNQTREEEDKTSEDSLEEHEAEGLRPEEKLVQKYEEAKDVIAGVDIKATPPGKKLASVQALSGGERALTAIALLCALLACFPSPFVVLDEVDAALDEANTIRFGQILASLAHQTQFVTITHNRETMAQSKALYGVTMGDDGVSKILSIKFDQATEYAK